MDDQDRCTEAKGHQVQNRLSAPLAHELLTPLSAILGFTALILMDLPGPLTEDQREQLELVESAAKRLLEIINWNTDTGRAGR